MFVGEAEFGWGALARGPDVLGRTSVAEMRKIVNPYLPEPAPLAQAERLEAPAAAATVKAPLHENPHRFAQAALGLMGLLGVITAGVNAAVPSGMTLRASETSTSRVASNKPPTEATTSEGPPLDDNALEYYLQHLKLIDFSQNSLGLPVESIETLLKARSTLEHLLQTRVVYKKPDLKEQVEEWQRQLEKAHSLTHEIRTMGEDGERKKKKLELIDMICEVGEAMHRFVVE
jgi:DNA-binding transcriptional MerR regulator